MKFVDYVTITVRSGKGGAGAVAFRREKYVPKGGPAGGDGGHGGSVVMQADSHLYTLLDLRYNRHHFAPNGQSGSGSNKTGKDGADIILRVPVGTVARDSDTDEPLGEVVAADEQLILAQGGRGGRGNTFFKSATNQTPQYTQPGLAGEERNITLELKLLADVGLVGFPNAGKSTLISAISAAKPKIADYPFTTLAPNLGVVSVGAYQSFVMADMPGIIEGAHEGRGLGHQFLKHIERNAVLLFVIPITEEHPVQVYETLLGELQAFNPELLYKPRLVVRSKMDIYQPDTHPDPAQANFPEDVTVLAISAVARQGLDDLKRVLWDYVKAEKTA